MRETTADTSVVVPAVATWHEAHGIAREAVHAVTTLPAHVLLEALAVLTRLPHGLAVPPADAADVLLRSFPGQPLTLPSTSYEHLLRQVVDHGVRGGLVYDALVGATARHAEARLLTLDRRAQAAYEAVAADVSFLA